MPYGVWLRAPTKATEIFLGNGWLQQSHDGNVDSTKDESGEISEQGWDNKRKVCKVFIKWASLIEINWIKIGLIK